MESRKVRVPCAVIVRDGQILLAERPPGKAYGECWECSGGKQEANETDRDTLAREIEEELGLTEFTIGELLFSWETVTQDFTVLYYAVEIPPNAVPQPLAAVRLAWVPGKYMHLLRLTPSLDSLLLVIKNYIDSYKPLANVG